MNPLFKFLRDGGMGATYSSAISMHLRWELKNCLSGSEDENKPSKASGGGGQEEEEEGQQEEEEEGQQQQQEEGKKGSSRRRRGNASKGREELSSSLSQWKVQRE